MIVFGCAHQSIQGETASQTRSAALSWYLRGLMLEKSVKLSEALLAYQQALEYDPRSSMLHVRLGATHVKLGQLHQALDRFQQALALEPNQPDALRWMAMLYTSQGNIDGAIQAYTQLVDQQPMDRASVSTLADLYVLQGDLARAVTLYEQLLQAHGPSAQLSFNIGILYGRMGQFEAAVQALSRALEFAPDSVDIWLALGLTYEMTHELGQARTAYAAAIDADPLNPKLYHHVARIELAQGRVEEAVQHYQRALNLAPDDLDAIIGLVRLWMTQRQFASAHRLLGEAMATLSRPAELYLMLGLVYREADYPVEALRAFESAAQIRPDSAQAHFYMGAQLERLQRGFEARVQLRRAIELDPAYADALNYLGYMDAEDGVNLAQAKRLIERAIALDPENGAYIDSLGWVYYQLGDVEEAVVQLERAAELLDTDPTIFDHLGEAYFKQGNLEQARVAWEQALALDPDSAAVEQKLRALRGQSQSHYEFSADDAVENGRTR